MKTSTKLILTAPIGTLGLVGLAKLVNAAQTQAPVAVIPTAQVTAKSDGDGKANPTAEAPENASKTSILFLSVIVSLVAYLSLKQKRTRAAISEH